MKILFQCDFDHHSSDHLYNFIISYLGERGIGAPFVKAFDIGLDGYDVVIGHNAIPGELRQRLRCFGGIDMSRTESLLLLERCHFPTMKWSTAESKARLLELFQEWNAKHLILKRSFTFGGKGVVYFDPQSVNQLAWNPTVDIFCKAVNVMPCEELFKAEIFNGKIILAWMRTEKRKPITLYPARLYHPVPPKRLLYKYSDIEIRQIEACSKYPTQQGLGDCSLDMMRDESNNLLAIELNTHSVATWWSAEISGVKERYARAVHALLVELNMMPQRSSP
jgi:hypothetical protein